ncbi:MAG: SDR family oxidoreductase [Nitriliruptoraceae bacterium]|nr:SDR family oxidoreductase [Nitriliruptoraceae bacterium]
MGRELDGQVAVVTGGSRGIGRAIALALAEAGADVVTLSRQVPEGLSAQLSSHGSAALCLATDVTDDADVAAARDEVLERFGRVDALVNNAGGLFAPRRPFWEYGPTEFDDVIALNLRSAFVCAAAFSEPMRAARSGRIVNIGSDAVGAGLPSLTHYLAAKAGMLGLTRGLASDLGPFGIGVNTVSPGLVVTEHIGDALPEEARQRAIDTQVLARSLVPTDIAAAVVFLCSPGAQMITGQTLQVNGGATVGAG